MIENIVKNISDLVDQLKSSINQDILDIKEAKHEELLKRNDQKHYMIDEIMNLKLQLNQELMALLQEGKDVNIYRQSVDNLEIKLKELYALNKKLAAIVLPVQKMYKDLVSEITEVKGGQLFDIKV